MVKCPVCDSTGVKSVFVSTQQPLARYGLCVNKEDAVDAPRVDVDVVECVVCGFMHNVDFEYDKVNYRDDNIQESRVFSPRIRHYMESSAKYLSEKIPLDGEVILEVGCGEGFFLSLFESSELLAFEPSPEGLEAKQRGIQVFEEYYQVGKSYDFLPKMIVMRQVLEHLMEPRVYLNSFSELLAKSEGYIYIEVPSGAATKSNARFQDLYYEHYGHYTPASLALLMEATGFDVIECGQTLEGEVISVLAKARKLSQAELRFEDERLHYIELVDKLLKEGKKVVAWGSAGNGSAFLNVCNFESDKLECVVDSDIRKQNKFIPGTGQLVIAPSELLKIQPDVVLILSQFHKKDIGEEIRELLGEKVQIVVVGDS